MEIKRTKRATHIVPRETIIKNASSETQATFSLTLNDLLVKKEIDQEIMADELGISSGALSNYRTGRTEPKLSVIIAMADYLGVDCHYLMTGVAAENVSIVNDTGLSQNAIERLLYYEKCNAISGLNLLLENTGFMMLCSDIGCLKKDSAIATKYERETPYQFEDFISDNSPEEGLLMYGYDVFEYRFQKLIRKLINLIEELTDVKALSEFVDQKRTDGLLTSFKNFKGQ